ncbi:MAG: S9 family peptidase [Bacteroidota bacterium]
MRPTKLITSLRFYILFLVLSSATLRAQIGTPTALEPLDLFDLKYISDPQISPNAQHIAYVLNTKDIMNDGNRSTIWLSNIDGSQQFPLHADDNRASNPRWSPDGSKLLYKSSRTGRNQVYVRWMEEGKEVKLSRFPANPSNIQWSPDGNRIAFTMGVPYQTEKWAKLPAKPEGAQWTKRPKVIEKLKFRADGAGFLPDEYRHLFIMDIDGGQATQVTTGNFNVSGGFSWAADGQSIYFSANHREDWEYAPSNTEIHQVSLANGSLKTLTERLGPDASPKVSPDGKTIAYLGFDDAYLGYQINALYLMDADGQNQKLLSTDFDRQVGNIQWAANGEGLYFQYDTEGNTRIAFINLAGKVEDLCTDVGGLSIGRPYGGGTYTVSKNGTYAFTHSKPDHPADLAVGKVKEVNRLTDVNTSLFNRKTLGEVEEIWYESSYDQQRIQGWICKPPNFDPNRKYPLLLEIHGGPFANYGDRFSMEVQLYAAAGYVVLYTNPRGSSSYGKDFGNLIHHNYPNQDYDDLISGVDAVIEKGYIDTDQLYVTGGSGGGVLTAWIVGKTDRFRAAVVAKPVINWYSFVLHADNPAFFSKYWFPDYPWNATEHYMKRSPISLVGNVKTPTMLLTGEKDYRTPMSETEQYYAALKLQKVPTALVRIQDAGHGITARPSNLINKVSYILAWFEKNKTD